MEAKAANFEELIESSEHERYTVFPIRFQQAYNAYKEAQSYYWVDDEINKELAEDVNDWATLDPKIRHFIEHILGFFAVSDGVVIETITEEIIDRIEVMEIKLWYHFQVAMEDIHNIVYSKLIDAYITDPHHKHRLLNAIENYPTIQKKIEWVHKWLGKDHELYKLSRTTRDVLFKLQEYYRTLEAVKNQLVPTELQQDEEVEAFFERLNRPRPSLARQLFINIIMEGVFFSGSFCAIYWIFNHYKKLPGLAKANEFISRDEGMHTEFGMGIYSSLQFKLSQEEAHEIIAEAVDIEADFIRSALPSGLLGMNSTLMTQYIKFVADQLLRNMGYAPCFLEENPFSFMNKQSTSVRIGDFFVVTVSEYGHSASNTSADEQTYDFSEDF
jgi:ribonucleotide reductase beta subunit family protein with ferritin-like domain